MGAFDRLRLYLQTDYRLDHKMNKLGCAVRALIAYVELRYRIVFNPIEIMEIVGEIFERHYLDSDYSFTDPGGIVEVAADRCGVAAGCYDVATRKGSRTDYYQWVLNSSDLTHDFTLLKWKTEGLEGIHFTLGDKEGNEIFDPYPVDIKKRLIYEILLRFKEI